ncbi:MLV-related proviral Env polyprotein-like [Hirundo rustica]|uniref:MLV-related proviral Env polyprotein-like n=1 Tax=Hirundo rustica TaxID=43150 RepID=UPI001A93F475|nr:MLV-related proviral Env polyprotein-like [Hirundo rustica]
MPSPFIAEIVEGRCQKELQELRCNSPQVKKANWYSHVVRSRRAGQSLLKNSPAAEKMIPLVARRTRVDERGRGRKTGGGKSLAYGTTRRCSLNCQKNGTDSITEFWHCYHQRELSEKKEYKIASETKHPNLHTIIWMLSLLVCCTTAEHDNPHQPFKWSLIRWEDHKVLSSMITPGNPSFQCELKDLFPVWPPVFLGAFYFCPASNPGKPYCNYPGHYYCAYWGCKTVSYGFPPGGGKDQFISVKWYPYGCKEPQIWRDGGLGRRGNCKGIWINVTKGEDQAWVTGKLWGARLWEPGTDRGGHFFIKKEPAPQDSELIGPNSVLQKEPELEQQYKDQRDKIKNSNVAPTVKGVVKTGLEYSALWKIMQASYQLLNITHPNLTQECWLCHSIRPPFYKGIGSTQKVRRINGTNPAQCLWKQNKTETKGVTLSQVTGKGRCIGKIPPEKEYLCGIIMTQREEDKPAGWLLPAANTKWVCNNIGVTPCLSLKVFNYARDYCIQVTIVPRIIYHSTDYIYQQHTTAEHHLVKREPFTALTIATLLTIGGIGAGTGVASLINQQKEMKTLQMSVDEDLGRIEQAIDGLVKSVRSLSEVVLQNRRALDLLFLQQGGLCVALKEECCAYADHMGVVIDTMTELRNRLEQRKREREANQNWYESWFDYSPWLTTLLSTIAGPLILLILGLTFGPCIFNKLITIVKGHLEAAHLMLIRAKYESLPKDSEDEKLEWARQELERFNEQI